MEKTEAKHEQVTKQAEQHALEHRQRLESDRSMEKEVDQRRHRLEAQRAAEIRRVSSQKINATEKVASRSRIEIAEPSEKRSISRNPTPDEVANLRRRSQPDNRYHSDRLEQLAHAKNISRISSSIGNPLLITKLRNNSRQSINSKGNVISKPMSMQRAGRFWNTGIPYIQVPRIFKASYQSKAGRKPSARKASAIKVFASS